MPLKQSKIALFVAIILHTPNLYAEEINLDEIVVQDSVIKSTNPLSSAPKPNDIVVEKQSLSKRASTLGNALNGELGVHSSQFGGGASAPIIRGQEGVRLKVLQNGLDVVDMSQLSPDHAIATDTLLANQVDIVRGASTLLYATASTAGVINVADNRIPTALPENGFGAEMGARYNSNSRENVENAAFTFGVGKHLVVRAEGLNRNANNYRVPALQFNEQSVHLLPNSFNKSTVGTLGASLIGEKGYFGVAYSQRQDRYGLVGHNHKFDSCYGHIVDPLNEHFVNRYYLHAYPHLMDDSDVLAGAHFDCGSGHEDSATPSHSHPFGHSIVGGPFIDMQLKRWEVRGELKKPVRFLSAIRLNFANSRYHHDEKEGKSEPINIFEHQANNARLEFVHTPVAGVQGVWGVQFQQQTSSAYVPRLTNPSRPLNYTATEVDKIIRKINGETNNTSAPKNSKPTIGGDFTPPNKDFDQLIGDLFVENKSSSNNEASRPSQGKPYLEGEYTAPTQAFDNLISGLFIGEKTSEKPETSGAETTENRKPSLPQGISQLDFSQPKSQSNFDDLLGKINAKPENPNSVAEDVEDVAEETEPTNTSGTENTENSKPFLTQGISFLDFSQPKSQSSFDDLLGKINAKPENPNSVAEDAEEVAEDPEPANTSGAENTENRKPFLTPGISFLDFSQPKSQSSFDDLLGKINAKPENPNPVAEDVEEVAEEPEPANTSDAENTENRKSPQIDAADLLAQSNPSQDSFDSLLAGINAQPEKNPPTETSDEVAETSEKEVENVPENSSETDEKRNALIDVSELVQKINAEAKPVETQKAETPTWQARQTQDRHFALVENVATQWAVFGMEQWVWRDVLFEFGVRHERQKVAIDYDHALLEASKRVGISSTLQAPDLSPNKQKATSFSGAAYWSLGENWLLSLILSHNERLPTPMELYYHGKHLATNSFEYGNKDLRKEISNNVEISLNYEAPRWSYTINGYYNHFNNRIFKQTLNKEGNLAMNRYAQASADYYGVEGKLDYQLTPRVKVGIFGDYVRGVLKDLPPLRLKDRQKNTYELPASRNAPRVPPARVGLHLMAQMTDHLSATARYTNAFAQRKVATLEAETEGYRQLDLGISYQNQWNRANYEVFVEANNLLNAKIYSHSSYLPFVPQMGRNVVMGMNMRF